MPRRITVKAPVLGLNYSIPAQLLDVRQTPSCLNVWFRDGVIEKRTGAATYGSGLPLSGIVKSIAQFFKYDGTSILMALTTNKVYKYDTASSTWVDLVELITNGDMEADSDWTDRGTPTTNERSDEQAHGGTYSRKIVTDATGEGAYQDISTTVGQEYQVTAWVYVSAGDAKIGKEDTDGSDQVLSSQANAASWTQLSVTFTATATTSRIFFQSDATAASTFYVDDVSVQGTGASWGSASGTDPHSICFMNDLIIFTNGVDTIKKWNGTDVTFEELGGATNYLTSNVIPFEEHLFLLNTTESGTEVPQRVRWSDAGDPETWDSGDAGSNDLVDTPGEIVTGKLLGNILVIYKDDSIVLCDWVGGNNLFRFLTAVPNIGLLAQDAIVNLGTSHIFLGKDNIYEYAGGNMCTPIGNAIKDELFNVMNDVYISTAFTMHFRERNEVWFFIPINDSTYPNSAWVYNYLTKSWSRFDMSMTAGAEYLYQDNPTIGSLTDTIGELGWRFKDLRKDRALPIFLLGDSSGNILQQGYSTSDNGTAITAYYDTLDFTVGEDGAVRGYQGRWLGVKYEAKGDSVEIYYSTDEGDSWTSVETKSLSSSWAEYASYFDVTSEKIRIRFRNANSTGQLAIRWFRILYMPRSSR